MNALKNNHLFKEKCYIDGKWIGKNSKDIISVENPATSKILGSVPNCTREDAIHAINAAESAFKKWRVLTASERREYLLRWAKLIDENQEDLSKLLTLEQGKSLKEARSEITYGNAFIKWYAEEGRRIYGDIIPANKSDQHLLVIKQPIGVVCAITPWNFPAAMITRKCAPALAAGCTVVVKPSEETPFTALALAALAEEAKIPPGVFNVITGDAEKIGTVFTQNTKVRKISFTGSTRVGKLLMQHAASSLKKVSLELGGNAPFIVFDDASIDAAVTGLMACKFRNTGQTCVSANRILVQDSIYDTFAEKLLTHIKSLRVGNGFDADVEIGPLINQAAIHKVEQHIADAVEKGATLVCGGKVHALKGLFFEPTLIINATASMQLAREETFGPVAALFRFADEAEAIQLANATEYGLASYFYSNNIHRVWRMAEALECGIVGINTGIFSTEVAPFGGVKASGIGREGSKYGIEEYVEIKFLCME